LLFAGSALTLMMFALILIDWQVRHMHARHMHASCRHCDGLPIVIVYQVRFRVSEEGMSELFLFLRAAFPPDNLIPSFKTAKRAVAAKAPTVGTLVVFLLCLTL
jgi:hypothetical protein